MKLLKENKWEIHVAARNNLAEKNGLQLEYPDAVFDIPFQRSPLDKRNIEAYKRLKQLVETTHYDVVHCNTPVGGVLARIAARKCRKQGTKVYYTAHGFHFYHGSSFLNWLIFYPAEKFLARYTDKLITINEEDYNLAKHKFSCPVYRIHGVGANTDKYKIISRKEQEKIRQQLGLSGHILINIGELLPNKNQKTAIAALKRILESYPDTYLLIASNGPEKEKLEEDASLYGVQEHVKFLGYTIQLQRYLEASDVEIACSYREGLPMNMLEAMLCGKPVVASNNRGHREVICEGTNGYLVDADDTDAYADRVCRLFSATDINDAAIRKSVELYTDYSVSQELKMIYLDKEK